MPLSESGLAKICLTYPDGKGGLGVRVAIVTAEDLAAVLLQVQAADNA